MPCTYFHCLTWVTWQGRTTNRDVGVEGRVWWGTAPWAWDPLEGGMPRVVADGTVSGRGGCGLAVGGSGTVT